MLKPSQAHAYTPVRPDSPSPRGVYRSPDRRWQEADYGEVEYFASRADNGIYTTPREFMRWVRKLYDGEIISLQSLELTNTPFVATATPYIGYGLGVYTQDSPGFPRKTFHSDSNGGFSAYEAIFPDCGLFYLIFANRPDWERIATAEKVDSILMANNLMTVEI